jgi:glycerophosphoryl diester phosphodiesterase
MPGQYNNSPNVDFKKPTIFAHRGASAYAPEDTLSAFRLAEVQEADAIELDAKLSADGQVVVIHDDTVDRTTNGTGIVKSLTMVELQKLDAGSKFPPLYKSEKIPSLAQVFETIGRKLFINIELANYSSPKDELVDKVVVLVKKFNLADNIILSSFNMIALIQARKLLGKIPLGLLTYPGLAEAALRSKLVRFGPLLALHPSFLDVTPNLIQTAHQAKCQVHAYTVNQPEKIHELYKARVDGIFTDDPQLARKILAEDIHTVS